MTLITLNISRADVKSRAITPFVRWAANKLKLKIVCVITRKLPYRNDIFILFGPRSSAECVCMIRHIDRIEEISMVNYCAGGLDGATSNLFTDTTRSSVSDFKNSYFDPLISRL